MTLALLIAFLIGASFGACVGVVLMGLMVAAARADRQMADEPPGASKV
jgi:hypothetical protein